MAAACVVTPDGAQPKGMAPQGHIADSTFIYINHGMRSVTHLDKAATPGSMPMSIQGHAWQLRSNDASSGSAGEEEVACGSVTHLDKAATPGSMPMCIQGHT